jgi:alkylhydroperoxidase family enzyme
MARIANVNLEETEKYIRNVLEAQSRDWGAPLLNHLLYARRPTIFRGARGMWGGIEGSGLIDASLRALINRRVAFLNGCEFWQDINAAVSSQLGVSDEKIDAVADYANNDLFCEAERVALEFGDAMTITGRDVSDELFERLRMFYDEDALVELTATIAWENASSKFNRALRVPSQQLWKRR